MCLCSFSDIPFQDNDSDSGDIIERALLMANFGNLAFPEQDVHDGEREVRRVAYIFIW